jgi:hypothetical protein
MAEGTISFEELEATATPAASATPQEPAAAAPPAEVKTETAEASKPQFTEADAESYRQLVEMGITPQTAAQFKAAKDSLEHLPQLLRTPDGRRMLLDEIQKNDPETYKGLLDYASDRWYNELPADARADSGNGSPSRTANSSPIMDTRLAAIESKIDTFIQKENQRETAQRQEQISAGYSKSVDNLLAKLPESTSSRDKDYIRLKTNELIWQDTKARESVAKGVYVDVPTHFSKASSLVTAETKAAANAEHDRRAGVEARGTKEIPAAAENVNGSASSKQEGHGHDPIWGDISSQELKSAYK